MSFYDLCVALILVVLIFIGLMIIVRKAYAESGRITVKDKNGTPIGYIDGETVKDKNGVKIGSVRNGRTYDAGGALVATPEVPGLLFCHCK